MNESLKSSLEACCAVWQLQDLQPIAYDAFINNYVATGYSRLYQKKCVLKISPKDTDHRERKALEYFNATTDMCVQLLDYNDGHNALLLEYVEGDVLSCYFPERDDEALSIAANFIKHLHIKPCSNEQIKNFKKIKFDLLHTTVYSASIGVSQDMLIQAQTIGEALIKSQKEVRVLHGDLHHGNIIYNGRCARAIDPKGVVAELEFEVIRFIMNPIPDLLKQPDPLTIINRRIEYFADSFNFEKERLMQWLFVCSVRGACWSYEDMDTESAMYFDRLAQLMEKYV